MALDSVKVSFIERFSIRNYDADRDLNFIGWANELYLRWTLYAGVGTSARSASYIEEAIAELIETPINRSQEEVIFAEGGGAVRELSVWAVMENAEFAKAIPEAEARYTHWLKEANLDAIPEELMRSYHETACLHDAIQFASIVPVEVHMDACDEQILREFSGWLKHKRQELSASGFPSPTLQKPSQKDLHGWSRWKVLAYLDIAIFERYFETKIPNHAKGAMLFPSEYGVDMAERIRKVVKPLAEGLVTEGNIWAITHLALKLQDQIRNQNWRS